MTTPKIMIHRGGGLGRAENSQAAISKAVRAAPGFIELDIRKSDEGILYCHHGGLIDIIFPQRRRRSIPQLSKTLQGFMTLREAVRLVAGKCTLFLDLKDPQITTSDLERALRGLHHRELYVASFRVAHLASLTPLTLNWVRVLNVGAIFPFRNAQTYKNAGISVVELFFWNLTPKTIRILRQLDIQIALSRFLLPDRLYRRLAIRHGAVWILDDFRAFDDACPEDSPQHQEPAYSQ